MESRGKDTSGPLNTDGSFMSFHVYVSMVEPLYFSRANCDCQYSRIFGSVKSGYSEVPGQHQPSKSLCGEFRSGICLAFQAPLYAGFGIVGGTHLPSSSSFQTSGAVASGSVICSWSTQSAGFLSSGRSIV